MKRGEITGEFFDISKADIGMPFRSIAITKKNDRKNISVMDDLVRPNDTQPAKSFGYHDPYTSLYHERLECQNELPQNISIYDATYMNSFSFKIYNEFAKNTYVDFCISPIGALSMLVERDKNIDAIIHAVDDFVYLKKSISPTMCVSRSSFAVKKGKSELRSYTDNDNYVLEFQTQHQPISMGFIASKKHMSCDSLNLNTKLFTEYITNLGGFYSSVSCPCFKIANKLNMNNTLQSLGMAHRGLPKYFQTVYFELSDDISKITSRLTDVYDLNKNFVFYVRYVPNNVILFIGRRSSF